MAIKKIDLVTWLKNWFESKTNKVTSLSDALQDAGGCVQDYYYDDNTNEIVIEYVCGSGATGTISIDIDDTWVANSTNPVESQLIQTSLNGKEDKTNKVTSLSSSSTDTQYPSAKSVYDEIQNNKFSGSYNDLTNKPTIPSKTSDLTNDSNYLQTNDIVDNLTSTSTTTPLSAKQGKELKSLVDNKLNVSQIQYVFKGVYNVSGNATNFNISSLWSNDFIDTPFFVLIKNNIADNNANATLKFKTDGNNESILDARTTTVSPIGAGVWKKDTWALFFCYPGTVHLKAIFYDNNILDTNYEVLNDLIGSAITYINQ